ncbi:hypothetical protein [Oceanobacillus timonensis]|uniref:hypothetical protein n=1 Tax=Oceanobacillus timonensis TaxID=1926285 RepID=UPI0009BB169D|nr:hypothetical protein [Oceanobacillus timonensis]
MKKRWKDGLLFAFISSVTMFVLSLVLGGEPYWNGVIGFLIAGFISGAYILPEIGRKRKSK